MDLLLEPSSAKKSGCGTDSVLLSHDNSEMFTPQTAHPICKETVSTKVPAIRQPQLFATVPSSKANYASNNNSSAVTPFRCLRATPPTGSPSAEILPSCPNLGSSDQEAKVGCKRRTVRATFESKAQENWERKQNFKEKELITRHPNFQKGRKNVMRKISRICHELHICSMHAMEAPGDSDSPKAGVLWMENRKKAHEPKPSKQGCTSPILIYKAIKLGNTVYYTGPLFEEHRPRCTMAYVNRPVLVVCMHAMEAPGDSDSPKAGVLWMENRKKAHEPKPSKQGCTSPILIYKAIKLGNTVYYTGPLFEEHRPRCTMAYVNRPVLVVCMHAMEAPGDSDSPKAGVLWMENRKKAHEPKPSKQGCTSPILIYKAIKLGNTVYYTGPLFEEHRPRCTMAYVNRPVLVVWCVRPKPVQMVRQNRYRIVARTMKEFLGLLFEMSKDVPENSQIPEINPVLAVATSVSFLDGSETTYYSHCIQNVLQETFDPHDSCYCTAPSLVALTLNAFTNPNYLIPDASVCDHPKTKLRQRYFLRSAESTPQLEDTCYSDVLPVRPAHLFFPLRPSVGSQVLKDLENLKTRLHNMEPETFSFQTIQPVACLLTPDATCDPANLEKASILIDTIAAEICQRIECRHQALLVSAPDRIPLEHAKIVILAACGMLETTCTARRLRKLKPSMYCPITIQFLDENDAPSSSKIHPYPGAEYTWTYSGHTPSQLYFMNRYLAHAFPPSAELHRKRDAAVSTHGYNIHRCGRRNPRSGDFAICYNSELRAIHIDASSLEGIHAAIWIFTEQTKPPALLSVEGWSQILRSPTRGLHTLDLIFSSEGHLATAAVGPRFP
ncbi:hypothetical protein CLF_112811, partial [Clonorchis sinensis]